MGCTRAPREGRGVPGPAGAAAHWEGAASGRLARSERRVDGLRPEPGVVVGRSSSSSSSNTSATASIAAGRTSSTVTGPPSSCAIVVNCASSSPHAVIHSVNGAGSRSTFSAYPCVVTQRETCTPIDAILRGPCPPPGGIHTPVRPSIAHALELERRERLDECLLEVAHVALHVLAVLPEVEDRVADELPGTVERGLARRGRSRRSRPSVSSGMWSSTRRSRCDARS